MNDKHFNLFNFFLLIAFDGRVIHVFVDIIYD